MRIAPFVRLVIAGSISIASCLAWAQQAPSGSATPDVKSNHAPMQAQDLVFLVPQDSSKAKPTDFSQSSKDSTTYQFNNKGVNCTLYPARCANHKN